MVALVVYRILDSCHEVRNVRLSHMQRKGNKPAHLLAKHALVIVEFFFLVWMEKNPCFLE